MLIKIIKYFAYTIVLMAVTNFAHSQLLIALNEENYIDSLNKSLIFEKTDSLKANTYFLLSYFYINTDTLRSKNYLETGKQLSQENPFNNAKYYFYIGHYYLSKDKKKAAVFFKKSIEMLSEFNTKEANEILSYAWYNYGITQKDQKGYQYLIGVLTEKSIPLLEKSRNIKKLGYLYSQLGIILTYNAEFQKAQIYLEKAIELLKDKVPDTPELLVAYLNATNNLCYQDKGDESKTMLYEAEKIIEHYPNSSLNPLFLYSKVLYYITKQKNEQALKTIDIGIVYSKKFGQNFLLQMFYFNKYDVLSKLGKLNEAKKLLKDIIQEDILINDASNKKTIYRELSTVSEKLGQYDEALMWSGKYAKISDSINQSQMNLKINELETKFRTSEKEKELAQNKLEINKKNQYMWVLGILSFILFFSAIFTFFYFKNKRKLVEQREINLQQTLREIEHERNIKLTRAILDGEERERQRVAKDLHDGLGGLLAGVKINLSSWSVNNLQENQYESFYKILNQLDHSVSELRNIARNLMPESLLNFGLEIALKDLCEFYMKENLKIEYQPINMDKNLPLNVQLNIYRIVQELLSNAVKHSSATNILLQCSQSETQFYITVEDNGIGIKKSDKSKFKSMGLKNLEDRVHYMNGHMEISSEENEGTSINIELYTNVA